MEQPELLSKLEYLLGTSITSATIRNYIKEGFIDKPKRESRGRWQGQTVIYSDKALEEAYATYMMLNFDKCKFSVEALKDVVMLVKNGEERNVTYLKVGVMMYKEFYREAEEMGCYV